MANEIIGKDLGFTLKGALQFDFERRDGLVFPFLTAPIGAAVRSSVPLVGAELAKDRFAFQALDGRNQEVHADMAEVCLLVKFEGGNYQFVQLKLFVHLIL